MEDKNLKEIEIETLGEADLEQAAGGAAGPVCSLAHCSGSVD